MSPSRRVWRKVREIPDAGGGISVYEGGKMVAVVTGTALNADGEQNADLILAAPAMYVSLLAAVVIMKSLRSSVEAACSRDCVNEFEEQIAEAEAALLDARGGL